MVRGDFIIYSGFQMDEIHYSNPQYPSPFPFPKFIVQNRQALYLGYAMRQLSLPLDLSSSELIKTTWFQDILATLRVSQEPA